MGRYYVKKSYFKSPRRNEKSRASFKRRNSKNTYFQRFRWYDSTLCRLLILIGILVVFFLTYCYMGDDKDYTSQDTYVQHKIAPITIPDLETKVISTSKPIRHRKTFELQKISDADCRMYFCFNYTRCPLANGFPIYVYGRYVLYNGSKRVPDTALFKNILKANNYITPHLGGACLFLVIVTELAYKENNKSIDLYEMENKIVFNKLPLWRRDGRNHLLLNLGQSRLATGTGFAIIAQSTFTHKQFRPGFDVVIPPALGPLKGEVWNLSLPISPARRTHLISFQGQRSSIIEKNKERDYFLKILQGIEWSEIHKIFLRFNCIKVEELSEHRIDDWALCKNRKSRTGLLRISTFVLIIASATYVYASTNVLQTRLYEALESGAIPVILGGDRIRLPYEEVLDWRKAVIRLPMARANELKFVLENMIDEDIIAFRKHGRMLWERYLGSVQASIDTLLAVIRTRLNLRPRSAEATSPSIYDFLGYEIEMKSFEIVPDTTSEEFAASTQAKKQPTGYKRNFTVGLLNGYELWNSWGDPFALYPEWPWDPILPPESRYLKSTGSKHYHQDICSPLAGDWPKENFTVVILTYNRKTILNTSIRTLSKMAYVHKIVVVCNGPKPSTEEWPTNIPIALVRAPHNSLNNRFLPYDLIETEAVFSVDDDAVPPNLEEIVFAFNVWREHRDQIVGFYGRNFHWNKKRKNGFLYTTNNSVTVCEVSILLTGAAFIHRYYLWAYWRQLPVSVRQFVDKHKNCEDIAMNFLVAHITRKAPIKVKSRWAYNNDRTVPTHSKLSRNSSHYQDRSKCINFFSKVFGYNPLLSAHHHVKPF